MLKPSTDLFIMLRPLSLSLAFSAAAACRHVQPMVPRDMPLTATCPLDTAPPALRIQAGAPHAISGILVQGTSAARADQRYALADLQLPSGRVIHRSADGGFRFDSLEPGT